MATTSEPRTSMPRLQNPFGAARPKGRTELVPELELRPMTGYEEEVVERRGAGENTARLCNEIVARCLVSPGADFTAALARVRGMLVAERDAALVKLRRISLGDDVELELRCPACGEPSTATFQLSALPLPDLRARTRVSRPLTPALSTEGGEGGSMASSSSPEGTGGEGGSSALIPEEAEVEVELESPHVKACLRMPDAGDQEALLDARLETASERKTLLLARTLLRLGDAAGPFDPEAVRALPVATRNAMEAALDRALPDLDLSMAVQCSECGHAFSEQLDVAAFFLPR